MWHNEHNDSEHQHKEHNASEHPHKRLRVPSTRSGILTLRHEAVLANCRLLLLSFSTMRSSSWGRVRDRNECVRVLVLYVAAVQFAAIELLRHSTQSGPAPVCWDSWGRLIICSMWWLLTSVQCAIHVMANPVCMLLESCTCCARTECCQRTLMYIWLVLAREGTS